MSKKGKTQSSGTEFSAEAFAKLWQDKWAAMLKEKGWPEGNAMPDPFQSMSHMPFMFPFAGGFATPSAPASATAADPGILEKIAKLEKRIAKLEKALEAKTAKTIKKPAAKTRPKG